MKARMQNVLSDEFMFVFFCSFMLMT